MDTALVRGIFAIPAALGGDVRNDDILMRGVVKVPHDAIGTPALWLMIGHQALDIVFQGAFGHLAVDACSLKHEVLSSLPSRPNVDSHRRLVFKSISGSSHLTPIQSVTSILKDGNWGLIHLVLSRCYDINALLHFSN